MIMYVSKFVQLIENEEVLAESELMPCTWNKEDGGSRNVEFGNKTEGQF